MLKNALCIIFLLIIILLVIIAGCDKNNDSGPHTFDIPTVAISPTASGSQIVPMPTESETPTPPDEIIWVEDLEEAINLALTDNKMIMIYFYTELCPYCRKLEKDVFNDPETATFIAQNYVTLRSNPQENATYAFYGGVSGVPEIIFTTPGGYEIIGARVYGYKSAEYFRQWVEELLTFWNEQVNAANTN